jgi:hypothetical protein
MPQKASDGIVHARTVLDCVLQLQRQGTQHAMLRLEQTEPDLANYLFETLSAIHQSLLELHAPASKAQRAYRQIELMSLVCIEALSRSHAELWQEQIDQPADPADSDQSRP